MNLLQSGQALVHFFRLTRDPSRLGEVFGFIETLQTPDLMAPIEAAFESTPDGLRALEEKPRVGRIDMAKLRSLPEGTLGKAYANHLDRNGLDPTTLPTKPAGNRTEFITAHLYETHDIWHAVTGFGADVAGELGLQAFYLAQFPARLAAALLGVGFMNMFLYEFEDRGRRTSEIARGWLIGLRAKSFLGARWAEMWEMPLDQVRANFNVDVVTIDSFISVRGPSVDRSARTSISAAQPASA